MGFHSIHTREQVSTASGSERNSHYRLTDNAAHGAARGANQARQFI
jgi:hypothetical protein